MLLYVVLKSTVLRKTHKTKCKTKLKEKKRGTLKKKHATQGSMILTQKSTPSNFQCDFGKKETKTRKTKSQKCMQASSQFLLDSTLKTWQDS